MELKNLVKNMHYFYTMGFPRRLLLYICIYETYSLNILLIYIHAIHLCFVTEFPGGRLSVTLFKQLSKDSWMENNISYETRVETWDSGNLLGGVLGTIVCPCLLAIELSVVQFTTSNYHFDTENVSHT